MKPADSAQGEPQGELYHKARCVLVREARRAELDLRQSYARVGKRALQKQGRYASAQLW